MLDSTCGPHCDIRSNAEGTVTTEGHCACGICHAGSPPFTRVRIISGPEAPADLIPAGPPMCTRWYEQSAGMKPWEDPRVLRGVPAAGCRPGAIAYPVIPASHGAGL